MGIDIASTELEDHINSLDTITYMLYQGLPDGGGCETLEEGTVGRRRFMAILYGLPENSHIRAAVYIDNGWNDIAID